MLLRCSGMPLCTHRLLPFHNNTAEDRLLPRMTDDTLCNEEWEHVSISKKMSLESCGSGYPKPSVLGIADRAMLTPPTVATPVSPRTTNDPPPVPPKEPSYFIQCGHHRRSPQTPPTPPPKDPHYLATFRQWTVTHQNTVNKVDFYPNQQPVRLRPKASSRRKVMMTKLKSVLRP